jgi:hypothetical protein
MITVCTVRHYPPTFLVLEFSTLRLAAFPASLAVYWIGTSCLLIDVIIPHFGNKDND